VVQGVPFACSCVFNLSITRFDPAPNNDHLFAFIQFCTWTFACCQLTLLSFGITVSDARAPVKSPLLIILATIAFVAYLLLIGAMFQYTVAHDNDKMGFFGSINCCAAGGGVFVKGIHKALMAGLSKCSDASGGDAEANSETNSPPPYTAYTNKKTYNSNQLNYIV